MHLITLILLAACTDTTSTSKDTSTPPAINNMTVTITATINFADWNDDMTEVIEDLQEVEGVTYAIAGTDITGTTPDTIDGLDPQDYTVTFAFTSDEGATYFGQAPIDVGETAELSTELCLDLTDEWVCQNTYDGTEYPSWENYIEVSDDCHVESGMDTEIMLDGHHFSSEDYDGIVSLDGSVITLNVYGNTGAQYGTVTCRR